MPATIATSWEDDRLNLPSPESTLGVPEEIYQHITILVWLHVQALAVSSSPTVPYLDLKDCWWTQL